MTEVLTSRSRANQMRANKPHYVYQFWAGSICLYVGCTIQPAGRISQHASSQPWWRRVTHFRADVYPDREAGRQEETRLIHNLQPEYNFQQTEKALGPR